MMLFPCEGTTGLLVWGPEEIFSPWLHRHQSSGVFLPSLATLSTAPGQATLAKELLAALAAQRYPSSPESRVGEDFFAPWFLLLPCLHLAQPFARTSLGQLG